ncbi:hypothetical protein [Lactobacillus sp. PV034]|uniref:hypothetical protein n=1 Tax=Lactobacillus sp. PV034 TaxID=2594495 RepID=UPI002240C4AA|nr:hypothetical protein [Lactobacillus sp. PV034]QNQ80791.1 hypothetical protein FP432_04095 [Lactobacillus sp. PV034]
MVKVIAKFPTTNDYLVISHDLICLVGDKGNSVGRLKYILNLLTHGNRPPQIGDFTEEYSSEELKKVDQKALEERKKFAKELIECEMPPSEVDAYIKERCEQVLADFNEAVGKEIFPNVKIKPGWWDKYWDDFEGI